DDQSDDDISDEDLFDSINIASSNQMHGRHRLQLLIGDYVLPYNISIYQGIKQYLGNDALENDGDESQLLGSKFWSVTFYIYYRLATESNSNVASSAASSAASSSSTSRSSRRSKNKTAVKKKDEVWLEGKVPKPVSPLEP